VQELGLTRRSLLGGALGAGSVAVLSACGLGREPVSARVPVVPPSSRPTTGAVRSYSLTSAPAQVDLGGTVVSTWAYGSTIPGTVLRATAGDRVQVAFTNELPVPSSVHWHGLAIPNSMDGVPGVTTPEVAPGGTFAFDFVVPDPGTHWFHPHTGLQLDRGLYAPFVIDDPDEPGAYDHEWVIVLDDWTDGVGPSPEEILADLQDDRGHSMMGGMMGGAADGDVAYPFFLINGRTGNDPDAMAARPGQKVRLRIINAGADTVFTVAIADHDLTVTHSDGFAVQPVTAQALRIGMGERYDVIVTLGDGVFPLVAEPVGKAGLARALIRTGGGPVPEGDHRPAELGTPPLRVDDLAAAGSAVLPARDPDSVQDLVLSGGMGAYVWTINGRTYDQTVPLTIREGQAGRLRITNHSMMSHPVHLHGHSFQVGSAGGSGPRKDTVLVPPMARVDVDFAASNPGNWMIHCHNAYHAEAGMMTRLEYVN
jgi:FtsP/CotA-like multicopper oxidase with cupredoxin domain